MFCVDLRSKRLRFFSPLRLEMRFFFWFFHLFQFGWFARFNFHCAIVYNVQTNYHLFVNISLRKDIAHDFMNIFVNSDFGWKFPCECCFSPNSFHLVDTLRSIAWYRPNRNDVIANNCVVTSSIDCCINALAIDCYYFFNLVSLINSAIFYF